LPEATSLIAATPIPRANSQRVRYLGGKPFPPQLAKSSVAGIAVGKAPARELTATPRFSSGTNELVKPEQL
jgi:hypothetical protein